MNGSYLLPIRTASCSTFGDYAIKKKMTVPYAKAKKGDVVLYDFNHNGTSDHTGIIYKVEKGKIYVVEGNTSTSNQCNGGMVMKRVRVKGNVNYIVRPKYDDKITADMVVETALAEVGVKENPKNSNKVKYNTWYYGKVVSGGAYPWCMTYVQWVFAHIIAPDPVTKPLGKYGFAIPNPTLRKGSGGVRVKDLQRFLNWYCGCKLKLDGSFGSKTEYQLKRFQRAEGIEPDGVYGSISYKKAEAYLPSTTPTNAKKIADKLEEFAYPYGTAKKKWAYKTGKPKAEYKSALKKYLKHTAKISQSDCGYFLTTAIRASGVSKSFKALAGRKEKFPKLPSTLYVAHRGKIPNGFLKAGDGIRYKKKGGGQHAMSYVGNGKIAEAGRGHWFPAIKKDTHKYNKKNVKHKTIEVIRAKE